MCASSPISATRRTASPQANGRGGAPTPPRRSRSANAAMLATSAQLGLLIPRPQQPRDLSG